MARSYICLDDHLLFTQAFQYLMSEMGVLTHAGSFTRSEDALHCIQSQKVDFLFTDLHMPGTSGIEAIQKIRQFDRNIKIIVVSMINDPLVIYKALESGSNGFIPKHTDFNELKEAIDIVTQNQVYLPENLKREIALINHHSQLKEKVDNGPNAVLSEREIEIVRYVSRGLTNLEIAEILFLSPLTVKTHRSNILKKLNLNNTAALIHYANQSGLI